MDYQHESGLRLEFAGSFDVEDPEERFVFPKLTTLKSWLARIPYDEAEVSLSFGPGIFIFSELTCENRDTGLFDSQYIKTLLPLVDERAPAWSAPSIVVTREELRPVPEAFRVLLENQSNRKTLAFPLLVESYINHVNEGSALQLLFNKSYEVYSPIGQSFEEFREQCIAYALEEKSEEALQLSEVFDREIQQLEMSLQHEAMSRKEEQDEEIIEQISAVKLACKRLLNKAISLHVLDVNISDEASNRWSNYGDTLREEAESLASDLDKYTSELARFAENLIERFSEIEKELNSKALDIETLEVPVSSCTMRILRVEKVWLPFWNIYYSNKGTFNNKTFTAH